MSVIHALRAVALRIYRHRRRQQRPKPRHRSGRLRPSGLPPALQAAIADASTLQEVNQQGMLGAALLVDLAIHCLVGVWSAIYATEKPFDATGTVAFLTLSLGSLAFGGFFHLRQVVVTAMVCAWTIRLGTFLVVRIARFGSDSRFDGMRERPAAVMVAYTFSAVWVFLTSLPALLLNGVAANPGLQPLDIFGGALWLCGLLLESLADAQKLHFKSQPENKGKFINTGLWRLARFPNYGGEILVWSGLYLVCCSAFSGWQYASVVSPVFVSLLLLNGSGVPLQQRQARARWGSDPAYQEYERSTRLLFPLPKFQATKSERSD